MKRNDKCLGCLVNQVVKVADMTQAEDREGLYKKVFTYFANMDYEKKSPEIIGDTFSILKQHIKNMDPYQELKAYYNQLFLSMESKFRLKIDQAADSFQMALKLAVIGNIIDFNPSHNLTEDKIRDFFTNMDEMNFYTNNQAILKSKIKKATTMLYIGDNCGEICLDKLFLEQIKKENPKLKIYFGVRGEAIVNDSIEQEAYEVGINQFATILSNQDNSLGTILKRTGEEFQDVFANADVILAKGQANYESLSETKNKTIFYLLMTKCDVIANDIGVPVNSLMCFLQKV